MQKYKCPRCGYIYDPEVGRPDKGTKKGILFEDLPDGWRCPECGEKKHSWPPWVKVVNPTQP
ncbi:MAG: rubredoxin [Planctomycetota bacterium]|nr:MAG: rubredoxin [Planctomycetota bacterium]